MDDFWRVAAGTVVLRPYVFAFFAAYLLAAIPHLGLKKTVYFTFAGYLIAFASEFASINTGFPYGWYHYLDSTSDRELWVAGVPFFDSLSYVFLAYCSYTMALLFVSPIKAWRCDLVILETASLRRSFAVLLLASLFQVYLDIIIDPVALQGGRWFLGQIYGYDQPGVHFGVPVSNYLGWFGVSLVIIFALQLIDRLQVKHKLKPYGVANLPFRPLVGPALYLSVLIFNLTVTFMIGENLMGVTGLFIVILPLSMLAVSVLRKINRYGKEELAEHLADYPWSAVSGRRG